MAIMQGIIDDAVVKIASKIKKTPTARDELNKSMNKLVTSKTGIRGIFLYDPDSSLVLLSTSQKSNIDFDLVTIWLGRRNLSIESLGGLGSLHSGAFSFSESVCYFYYVEPKTPSSLILSFICKDSSSLKIIEDNLPSFKQKINVLTLI